MDINGTTTTTNILNSSSPSPSRAGVPTTPTSQAALKVTQQQISHFFKTTPQKSQVSQNGVAVDEGIKPSTPQSSASKAGHLREPSLLSPTKPSPQEKQAALTQSVKSEDSSVSQPSVAYYAKKTPALQQQLDQATSNLESQNLGMQQAPQPQLCEIREVTAHKTVKGTKGFHYRCVWVDPEVEPTWEPESHIKPTADKLLNLYWRQATKSIKPEGTTSSPSVKSTTPLKQSLLHTTKRVQASQPAPKHEEILPKPNSALTVVQITQKAINCSTPELSPEKGSVVKDGKKTPLHSDLMRDGGAPFTTYDDLETAFLQNIGNWKKQRRQDNKDIYRCNECECRLEVEKRGSQFKVRVKNSANGESHSWFDQSHLEPFQHKEPKEQSTEEENSNGRLHSSVECFVKLKMKDQDHEDIQPEVLLDVLRRERPKLYSFFRPTLQQLCYYMISSLRRSDLTTHYSLITSLVIAKEDGGLGIRRAYETSGLELAAAAAYEMPSEEEPTQITTSQVTLRKREVKQNSKRSPKAEAVPQEPPSSKKVNSVLKNSQGKTSNGSPNKRVKFNKTIEQVDFLKQTPISSEDEADEGDKDQATESEEEESDEPMEETKKVHTTRSRQGHLGWQSSQDSTGSQPEETPEQDDEKEQTIVDVSSDEENLESGAFLELIKQETEKAVKERHFLMKELRAKERRGSIFVDTVKRVVAAVQRTPGKFDYLIEWDYNLQDKITPSTTLVRGSHFVFSNPLAYRRYVEKHFVEAKIVEQKKNVNTKK